MEPPENDSGTSLVEELEDEPQTRGWSKGGVAAGGVTDPRGGSPDGGNGAGGDEDAQLTVRLLHASLEHAVYPVLVGHVAGSPLSGAEERLDDCLDHRLSRAQVAHDYPEALGEFRHFPGFEDITPPPGAIVVGLGPMGELTESQLSSVVTRSLTRFASEPRDRARASVVGRSSPQMSFDGRLGLAAVLIGSSRSGGLTVESSIRAIIAGTVAANVRLRQIPLTVRVEGPAGGIDRPVRFSDLWFVERHEDVVELAARSLERLANESGHTEGSYSVSYVPRPVTGEGAAGSNPPDDSANDVWARISIVQAPERSDGMAGLTYSLLGRASRAEQLVHELDGQLVESLVTQSISRSSDPRIGSTLYELLVPHDLKQPLGSGSHLHLLLDEGTADFPWELLTPRAEAFRDSRPFALGGGLLRQFLEARDARRGTVRAPERAVLVIGNPPPGPGFLPLPGAKREGAIVAKAFGAELTLEDPLGELELPDVAPPWQVTARIWDEEGAYIGTPPDGQTSDDPAEEVIHELMNGSWRVVHIAAHGMLDEGGDAARSGVVLGPGRRLTAATIGQLSVVPDLVVVNACHLGAVTRQLDGMNRVAASFARRLMQIGVRAVVVAGWAVEDGAAVVFAHALYSELLEGWELGDAVRHARAAVHRHDPGSLTWGAYQCYGDPGFRLAARRGRGGAERKDSLTVSELRRRIRATTGLVSDRTSSVRSLQQDIRAVAERASETPASSLDLVAELERLELDPLYAEGKGSVRADISADLAAAWAQLGRFDLAVERYSEAVRAGGRDVPLAAVEQLINLSVRRARELDDPEQRLALLRSARHMLRALQTLGLTGERLALWGSFYKKRACLSDPPNRDDVRRALRCYIDALKADVENQEVPDPYHELNARQLTGIVRQWGDVIADVPCDDEHRFRKLLAEPPADFWSRNGIGDWMLTRLIEQELGGEPAEGTVVDMVDAYETAFRLRSSAFNRRSVIEHLVDLGTLLDADRPLKAQLLVGAEEMRLRWLPSE